LGLDIDPVAISTARENARLNKITAVNFRVSDVRSWKAHQKIDIISANLLSELLIGILPALKAAQWLILSGILRAEEHEFLHALHRHRVKVVEVRRRGKWIAVLARKHEGRRFSAAASI
jgi:ribosomal protein L11 methyltransferase